MKIQANKIYFFIKSGNEVRALVPYSWDVGYFGSTGKLRIIYIM